MQEYREPLFCKGRVLKKESLEALRDFPVRFARLGLSDWADGVLFGYDISYECGREGNGGQLVIDAGAVWQEGEIVLTEQKILPFDKYDQPAVVRLRLYPASYTDDFYVRPYELCLEGGEPEDGGLELGRFRLSEGAELRKEYRDLQDFGTAYNTLNITGIPYAGPGGTTVSPVLLRAFAHTVMESDSAGSLDVNFALLCLNHPPVSRECVLRYVSRRLCTPYRELTHGEIYERLVRIAGNGNGRMVQAQKNKGPAVI
ncbi:MAG: DNA and RNA helicase [Lachnospiraceae bacterium]|nr:DNA and RNA helicase [Lachnospiraceae bacterium]